MQLKGPRPLNALSLLPLSLLPGSVDIRISGNRLGYRACDIDGQQPDELVIEK